MRLREVCSSLLWEFRHEENVLEDRGRGCALGVHANGYVTDTGGLNGTLVAKDDVDGGSEGGEMVEPVTTPRHDARGARVHDPSILRVLRTGADLDP